MSKTITVHRASVWSQKVMNVLIPCTFLMSFKLKETSVYERKWILHLTRDKQAGVYSQLQNTWRFQGSSGSGPPASVTVSQLSAQFQTLKSDATNPVCEWRGSCDFHRHSQLCGWKTHHLNRGEGKRCKMNPRLVSMGNLRIGMLCWTVSKPWWAEKSGSEVTVAILQNHERTFPFVLCYLVLDFMVWFKIVFHPHGRVCQNSKGKKINNTSPQLLSLPALYEQAPISCW